MSESKKNTRRGSLLEFELPSALMAAVSEKIGSRKLARLTPEGRAKIVTALNVAAEAVTATVGEELGSKRAGSTTRRRSSKPADQSGDGGSES